MVLLSLDSGQSQHLLPRVLCLMALLMSFYKTTVLFPKWRYGGVRVSERFKRIQQSPIQVDDGPCPTKPNHEPTPEYPKEAFANCTLLRRKNESLMNHDFIKFSPIVIESHKLLLFYVRKVASRKIIQLARRMIGLPGWNKTCKYLDSGLTVLYDYPPMEAEAMMLSKEWTRAVFVRDPKERLLSAYLNKIETPPFMQRICCHREFTTPTLDKLFQCENENVTKLNVSFADFVQRVVPTCPNLHWTPQSQLLRPQEWNTINFVGDFSRLEQDGRQLLERIGAWQEFGATGWPHGSLFHQGAVYSVETGAKEKMRRYYTPELEKQVDALYKDDYDLAVLNLAP